MALLAWYPLHKDTNDWSGFENHAHGANSTSGNGVIGGNVLESTLHIDKNEQLDQVLSGDEATLCFWVQGDSDGSDWADIVSYQPSTGAATVRFERGNIDDDVNQYDYWCNWFNGATSGNGVVTTNYRVGPIADWHHVTIRRTPTRVSIYINAEFDRMFNVSNDISPPTGAVTLIAHTSARVRLQDVRFYDNAISDREMKDIALGTVAKWNMNGANEFLPRNSTRNPDFLPGAAYVNGTWDTELNKDAILCESWSSGYNGGVPDPEIGYHAKWVNIDGKAVMRHINDNQRFGYGDRWMGISCGHGNLVDYGLEVGDRITVSWTQRSTHTGATFNVGFYTRRADNSTKWESGKITHTQNVAGEWERKSYTTTVGSDTDVNRSITIYFYGHYSVEGATMEAKDIQFECHRDVANPYRKFSADDVIVSDMTGLENNALLEYDYAPSYVENDTERGSGHFHFPSSGRTGWNDIRRHIRTTANHMSRQVSVAFWARTTQGDNRNPFMKYDDGIYTEGSQVSGGAILLCLEGNRFRMHGWGSSDPICSTHTNDGEWHHYVWTFDYDTRLANMFVDGVREVANSLDSEGVIQPLENYVWTIGANMHPYSSTTGATFNGDITEVSIHGKALSVDEVSRLYNVKASVDNLGNAHAVEFQEGWDHDGENTIAVRSSSSGNTGTYVNGTKVGVTSSWRGINFCIFDQSMTLRAYGGLDTYSGTTTQYYEFDGEVIVASANDIPDSAQVAANHLKDAIDRMEDGWLMTAARCDASTTQDGTLGEYFERYFGVTENHAIASRGTWGFIGIKNGELLTQFSDGRRYDATSGSITYYTKEYAATGGFHKPQVTKNGVMHAGELIEVITDPDSLGDSQAKMNSDGSFIVNEFNEV
ncbi:virion structural protein [Vibrio phage D482]